MFCWEWFEAFVIIVQSKLERSLKIENLTMCVFLSCFREWLETSTYSVFVYGEAYLACCGYLILLVQYTFHQIGYSMIFLPLRTSSHNSAS